MVDATSATLEAVVDSYAIKGRVTDCWVLVVLDNPRESRNDPMSTSTATNIRHTFFIFAGAAALILTWPHAFRWMADGGNILNPIEFFGDAMAPGGTAAFLSIDMAIAWLVFMVWVVFDSKRIGLGYKWGWVFVALSYIGVSMAFPVYLVTRERYLDKHAGAPEFVTRQG